MVGRMLLHLTEWLSLNSCTIAFPEIAAPVVAELQRAARSAKVIRFQRQLKHLVGTVRKSSALVLEARARVNFAPKDLERVREFERALAAKGDTPLQQLLREERRAAETRDTAQFAGAAEEEESESDDDSDEEANASRKEKRAARATAAGDEDEDEDDEAPKSAERAKKGKAKAKNAAAAPAVPRAVANAGTEDMVTDFNASEFFS
ncbi:Noc2p family-domain-containing protein [Pavlovales sp. CCMP2436]|nr:Noc2p family-domain-containing protein [Pavlovales sp. CCMP2436]